MNKYYLIICCVLIVFQFACKKEINKFHGTKHKFTTTTKTTINTSDLICYKIDNYLFFATKKDFINNIPKDDFLTPNKLSFKIKVIEMSDSLINLNTINDTFFENKMNGFIEMLIVKVIENETFYIKNISKNCYERHIFEEIKYENEKVISKEFYIDKQKKIMSITYRNKEPFNLK